MGLVRYWLLVLFHVVVSRSSLAYRSQAPFPLLLPVSMCRYYLAFVLYLASAAGARQQGIPHPLYVRLSKDSREQLTCLPMEAIVLLS
jgi:hypothetical protein